RHLEERPPLGGLLVDHLQSGRFARRLIGRGDELRLLEEARRHLFADALLPLLAIVVELLPVGRLLLVSPLVRLAPASRATRSRLRRLAHAPALYPGRKRDPAPWQISA